MFQQSSTTDTTGTEFDVPTSYNGTAATAKVSVSDAPKGYNGEAATAKASVAVCDFVMSLQSNGPVRSIGHQKGTTTTAAISLEQ
jgi:hypothetical protein